MFKIYYHTHQGNERVLKCSTLGQTARRLERLYKGRIRAKAFNCQGNSVGEVWRNEGKLTWHCEIGNRKPLSLALTELAYEVVQGGLNFLPFESEKLITLSEGEEWQGDLYLYWHDGKFQATLNTYRYLGTVGGNFYQPPEHVYDEDQHEAKFVKIKDLVEWVKEHDFDLVEELG